MRVLIYTPVFRLEPETVHSILTMDRAGCDVQLMFDYENPEGESNDSILYKYKRMQKYFCKSDYDAVLVIESDVIVPHDALEKLLAVTQQHPADVVNGLYYFRRTKDKVANAIRATRHSRDIDQSWSLFPGEEKEWVNKVIRTTGLGLGCSLIMGHVLHGVTFRSGGLTACDWTFATDCLKHGYQIWSDTSILCGHKQPDGTILWPDGKGGYYLSDGELNNDYHLTEAVAAVEKARQHNGTTVNA